MSDSASAATPPIPPTPPIIERLRERCRTEASGRRVVLPEGGDSRIREAARTIVDLGLCEVQVLDAAAPIEHPDFEAIAAPFLARWSGRGMPLERARELAADPYHFAGLLVASGRAEGAVMGAVATTAETLRAALRTVGPRPGLRWVSSCFLIAAADGRNLIYADCAKHASRPFDLERDGFVIGEGAGLMILEELEFAKARGANILAEIVGYGMSGDAFHVTMPDETGSGAIRVMERAIKDAGISPEQIGYINAHGTSTPYNDKFETLAIKKVFGEHAYKMPVSSTKSMTGHALGAAGGLEAVFSIKAMLENKLPPTINYESPDPDCDLDYIPNAPRDADGRVCAVEQLRLRRHECVFDL